MVRSVDVPEVRRPGESATDYVRRLAEAKAFAEPLGPREVVLGADTVVVVDGQVLEKPRDAADAARMLGLLSGREHEVITGICLRTTARKIVDVATTRVRFVILSSEELNAYVASGEPMDKAGAYAIQGLAVEVYRPHRGRLFQRGGPAGCAGLSSLARHLTLTARDSVLTALRPGAISFRAATTRPQCSHRGG